MGDKSIIWIRLPRFRDWFSFYRYNIVSMDGQVITTLVILGIAVLLFVTEILRVDLVALLILSALALTGLVSPSEAVSGFSNPAVITVWAVFILSTGLSRTGVASVVGRAVLRIPRVSAFVRLSLAESRLGTTLGINVIAILRQEHTELAPGPETRLVAGDRLLVAGRLDWLYEMQAAQP